MQIALTKKLAGALGLKLPATAEDPNPLFKWTANWMKVWENRKADDLLVLVNHATRFAVAVYQFKRKDLKNFDRIMRAAIENTMFAMNFKYLFRNKFVQFIIFTVNMIFPFVVSGSVNSKNFTHSTDWIFRMFCRKFFYSNV